MTECKRAPLSIQFTILGASIAGLSSAVALASVGHHVVVLEKESKLGGSSQVPSGGARLPPNGSRILYQWGLEERVRAASNTGRGFVIHKYLSDEYIGTHRWDEELIRDAGADFVQLRHTGLLQILYDSAIALGVLVRFGTEVISLDPEMPSVKLASGEVVTGSSVIVGADGLHGIVRRHLLAENEQENDSDEATGISVYSAIIPKSKVMQDSTLAELYDDDKKHMVTFSMGHERGAQALVVGHEEDLAFWVYSKKHAEYGTWIEPAAHKVKDVVEPCNERIRKLAALVDTATCVPLKNYVELKSWVSESGAIIAIGEAAHPFPTLALHAYSIAMEDGAYLGKLFANFSAHSQIGSFLQGFEDIRKPRCDYINMAEKINAMMAVLPDGEVQEARDAFMRQNEASGRNVMDGKVVDSEIGIELQTTFGYDAGDDAENWFVTWGRLRAHAEAMV